MRKELLRRRCRQRTEHAVSWLDISTLSGSFSWQMRADTQTVRPDLFFGYGGIFLICYAKFWIVLKVFTKSSCPVFI